MAKLPNLRRILRQDVGDAPDYIYTMIDVINRFNEDVYSALNKRLTIEDNFSGNLITFTVNTLSTYPTDFTPFNYNTNINKKANGVIVVKAINSSTNNFTSIKNPVFVEWTDNLANGNLTIQYVSGLQPSTSYTITILVI